MRRSWWMMALLGVCLTASGWGLAAAWSEEDKPREGDKPAVRDGEDRPRPPRPDGEREGPPRRDGDAGPRREGDRPDGPPPPRREGDAGPRREGDRPDGPPPARRDGDAGPRREGDRPDGPPPPRREGEGRPPMGPPREGGPREGVGRPPMGPPREGGPREGNRPPFGPPREADFEGLRDHDPEMYELLKQDNDLDRDTRSLADKLRKIASGAADRLKFEGELKDLVQKHFDVRQRRRELELKRVEEQLNRLRDSIKSRLEGREDAIRRRIGELIGRPEDLGF